MDSVYHVSNFLQRMTLRTFADWRVTGAENVPPMGPLVVVANHMSNVDSSLLGVSVSEAAELPSQGRCLPSRRSHRQVVFDQLRGLPNRPGRRGRARIQVGVENAPARRRAGHLP